MPLFEVAVLRIRSKVQVEAGEPEEELVVAPTAVVAKDKDAAILAMSVGRKDLSIAGEKHQMKVLVRPFV